MRPKKPSYCGKPLTVQTSRLSGHQGPPPQRYSRLVRLADSRCRKRPCCSRTYRCWSRRCRHRWPGYHSWLNRCLLRSRLLLGSDFLCCRFLRRYFFSCRLLFGCCFFGCRLLFGSGFFSCRLLFGCYFFSCRLLFGSGFLCCRFLRRYLFSRRLLGCCLFCCWFSFLLCCHFVSPSVMKVKKIQHLRLLHLHLHLQPALNIKREPKPIP